MGTLTLDNDKICMNQWWSAFAYKFQIYTKVQSYRNSDFSLEASFVCFSCFVLFFGGGGGGGGG